MPGSAEGKICILSPLSADLAVGAGHLRGGGDSRSSTFRQRGVVWTMKTGIHPPMGLVQFRCASCESRWVSSSTRLDARIEEFEGAEYPTIVLETCSNCHPFFTQKQTFIDTAGRVEKFQKRFAKFGASPDEGSEVKSQEKAKGPKKG